MMLKRLKELREDNDLTQNDIAKLLNTTFQNYHRYESGKIDLPIRHLQKLCEYYQVSADYILELPANLDYPINELNLKKHDIDTQKQIDKTARRLKSIRKKETPILNQKRLGWIFSMSQKEISRLETGQSQIKYMDLIKYSTFYNVSADYILGLIDYPRPLKNHKK